MCVVCVCMCNINIEKSWNISMIEVLHIVVLHVVVLHVCSSPIAILV